jgi:hypothetical protein
MSGISKAFAKRNLLFAGVLARMAILTITMIFGRDFRLDEFPEILIIQLPSSALYFTLLIVYLVRHAYRNQRTAKKVSRFYAWSGYVILIAITLAEAGLIYFKAQLSDNIPGDLPFYNYLLFTEALLAVFTAIYPSNLLVVAVVDDQQTPT